MLTGDGDLDALAKAGLDGLAGELTRRSSVEPAPTIGVDLEADELSLYPLLYWPISEAQPLPSPAAYARLNRYLAGGGLILFDTRDANLGGAGRSTPAGQRLRALAAPLDVPPLEPIPLDHVLTRTFYLLGDFPGRHAGQPVWAEAAPADAEQAEGMPFRNLNDGVTPVIIGGNDWAGAWAVDASGRPMLPVGRGGAGERQREMAYRFGVNLVMHVLTGNYKSDQVHVPALVGKAGPMNATSVIFDPAAALACPGWAGGAWRCCWWRWAPGAGCRAGCCARWHWRGSLRRWQVRPMQQEDRDPLSDILLVLLDESASQGLSDRADQSAAALAAIEARVAAAEGLELSLTRVADGAGDQGTRLASALSQALAELPRDRVAGVVVISDGRAHDVELMPDSPGAHCICC